jgi:hypothetical protein
VTERTTTAYLSDGRHIDVPLRDADEWARQAAERDTTLGLADWYTDQGDEHQDEIQGKGVDDPRCEHLHQGPHNLKRILVVNTSQAGTYDPAHSHAAASVCGARACILDAMAWVERATGERAVWIEGDDEGQLKHTVPPREDVTVEAGLEYPLDQATAESLIDEEGFATFTIALDKDSFLYAVANSDDFTDRSVEDFVHEQVLAFGFTIDSRAEAVAIDGEIITIEYTTNVAEALKMEQQD